MGELADQLAAARAEVARLERQAATASCHELGHDWKSMGGANCGCHDVAGCSVPVHECTRCGDCDYGDNEDADQIRKMCARLHSDDGQPDETQEWRDYDPDC